MANKLTDAIRNGVAEEIAESIYQRFAGDIRDDQALEISQAIVAAREKPEDARVGTVVARSGYRAYPYVNLPLEWKSGDRVKITRERDDG